MHRTPSNVVFQLANSSAEGHEQQSPVADLPASQASGYVAAPLGIPQCFYPCLAKFDTKHNLSSQAIYTHREPTIKPHLKWPDPQHLQVSTKEVLAHQTLPSPPQCFSSMPHEGCCQNYQAVHHSPHGVRHAKLCFQAPILPNFEIYHSMTRYTPDHPCINCPLRYAQL